MLNSKDIRKVSDYLKDLLKKPGENTDEFRYGDIIFFLRFARSVQATGIISLCLTVITTGLGSLIPLSSKVLIDYVVMKKDTGDIERFLSSLGMVSLGPSVSNFLGSIDLVVLSVLSAGIAIGLIGLLQKYLMLRFQQEVTYNLQTALFDHLLRFPYSFFKKKQTGYLMSRVSEDVYALQYIFSQGISEALTRAFYLIFGIALLFTLDRNLAFASLAVLPLYVFINYYFSGRMRSISRDERESGAEVSKDLQEVISGVDVVKSYTGEEKEVSRVAGKIRGLIHKRIGSMVLFLLSSYSSRAVQLISTVIIMWVGAREILKGVMTVGDYVAFTTYIVYLTGAINSLSGFMMMLQPMFASMDRLKEIFNLVPEFSRDEEAMVPAGVDGDIVFRDVSFSYDAGGKQILKSVNFHVRPGEMVALEGPSGAGKTTLINMLLKFYVPQSGCIYLDGNDLQAISTKWLRGRTGVVSQETFLFNDTVENNIRYGRPGASRDEVIRAARDANIHEEIERLAEGYETVTGERGVNLSVGQKQRISIARAFLTDPAILILDEPTSALDAETENLLKETFRKLAAERTTFIISHRSSVTDLADRVFVLEDGQIRERER